MHGVYRSKEALGRQSPKQEPRLSAATCWAPRHGHEHAGGHTREWGHEDKGNSSSFISEIPPASDSDYSISQRMLLTFTWCQILIFCNLYNCTWVSKTAIFSTTLSNRAVVKLLSFITACHMLPYPPQLEKGSFYLTSSTAFGGKHLFWTICPWTE